MSGTNIISQDNPPASTNDSAAGTSTINPTESSPVTYTSTINPTKSSPVTDTSTINPAESSPAAAGKSQPPVLTGQVSIDTLLNSTAEQCTDCDVSEWSVKGVTGFPILKGNEVGIKRVRESNLLPWYKQFYTDDGKLQENVTAPPNVRDMFQGAWDISAGALLFQHKMLLAASRYYRTANFVRRTARRSYLGVMRTARRGAKPQLIQDICRRILASLNMPGHGELSLARTNVDERNRKARVPLDPYGILTPGESRNNNNNNILIEYAWFVFATLRNVLTRSEMMTRPVDANHMKYVGRLAYLYNRFLKAKVTGLSANPIKMGPALRKFCDDTNEFRFDDYLLVFEKESRADAAAPTSLLTTMDIWIREATSPKTDKTDKTLAELEKGDITSADGKDVPAILGDLWTMATSTLQNRQVVVDYVTKLPVLDQTVYHFTSMYTILRTYAAKDVYVRNVTNHMKIILNYIGIWFYYVYSPISRLRIRPTQSSTNKSAVDTQPSTGANESAVDTQPNTNTSADIIHSSTTADATPTDDNQKVEYSIVYPNKDDNITTTNNPLSHSK